MRMLNIMAGLLAGLLVLASCGGAGGDGGTQGFLPHDPDDAFEIRVGCAIPLGMGRTTSITLVHPWAIPLPLFEGEYAEVPWDLPEAHYYEWDSIEFGISLYDAEIDWVVGASPPEGELVWGVSDFYGFIVRLSKPDDPLDINSNWFLEVHLNEEDFMESLIRHTGEAEEVILF